MAKFTRRIRGSKRATKSNKSVRGGESWNSSDSSQGWNSGSSGQSWNTVSSGWNTGSSSQGWDSGSSNQGSYITNTYQDQPQVFNAPQDQPQIFNVPQEQPQVFNVPQPQIFNVPQPQLINIPQDQAQIFNVPQSQVVNVPQLVNIPQPQIVNVPQQQVFDVSQPAQNWSNLTSTPQNAPGVQNTLQPKGSNTFRNTTAVLNSPRLPTGVNNQTYVTTPTYVTGPTYHNQYSNYPSYGYSSFGYPSYSYGFGYPGYSMFGYSPYSGYYGNSFAGVGLGLGLGLGSNYLYGQQYNQPVTVSIGQAGIAAGPSVVINKANPGLTAGPVAPVQVQQAPVQVQAAPVQAAQAPVQQAQVEAPPPDYYGILGVSRDATKSDIDKAYAAIKAAMNKNPKKNNTSELMKTLNAAFNTLSTNTKRKSYNSQVNSWVKAHPPVMKNATRVS